MPAQRPAWGSVYYMGGSSLGPGDLFLADYRALAPGSQLLQADLSDHNLTWWSLPRVDGGSSLTFLAGMHPFATEARNGPELRVGVRYALGHSGPLEYSRTRHYAYDTLQSLHTGGQFVVDSITHSRYEMRYDEDRIGLDASLIFRTPEAHSRWNLYGGVGVGGGIAINREITIHHSTGWSLEPPYDTHEEKKTEEHIGLGTGGWFSASVPMGLGFRLARREGLLNRMDLFLEYRPQVLIYATGDPGTRTLFGSEWLLGLRARLYR